MPQAIGSDMLTVEAEKEVMLKAKKVSDKK